MLPLLQWYEYAAIALIVSRLRVSIGIRDLDLAPGIATLSMMVRSWGCLIPQ